MTTENRTHESRLGSVNAVRRRRRAGACAGKVAGEESFPQDPSDACNGVGQGGKPRGGGRGHCHGGNRTFMRMEEKS